MNPTFRSKPSAMERRDPPHATAIGIASERPLPIGFTEARPWSYRADRALLGLDVAAIEFVAASLGRSPEYRSRQSTDLAAGLLAGEYDIAIGGLLPDGHRDIQAIPVPHARVWSGTDARAQVRRVFFPNVWWVRRADVALRIRLRVLLFKWRLSMRHARLDTPHAR
jgi:ABC-type amino acid transport substrate-binding protein